MRKVTRNRAASEVEKNSLTLDTKGRTPPFRRLTCACVSQCAVSFAAFALSPVQDGLQQQGDGWWWETCSGIASDTSKLERVFQFLESFRQCVWFSVVCVEEEEDLSGHMRGRCCIVSKRISICSALPCAAGAQT